MPTKPKRGPRLVVEVTEAQQDAVDELCGTLFPGASMGYVLRRILADACRKAKIDWPEE
jgi:hypothetical protein